MSQGTELSREAGTDSAAGVLIAQTPTREKVLQVAIPLTTFVLTIIAWQLLISMNNIPRYILPGPGDVVTALFTDSSTLWPAMLVTIKITLMALALALIGGVGLAILIVQSRLLELALFPYAVVLQVTPIIAIAPLLQIGRASCRERVCQYV